MENDVGEKTSECNSKPMLHRNHEGQGSSKSVTMSQFTSFPDNRIQSS